MLKTVFNAVNVYNELRHFHQSRHLKFFEYRKKTQQEIARRPMGNVKKVRGLQRIKEPCETDSWQQTFTHCQVKILAFFEQNTFISDSDFVNSMLLFRQHTVKKVVTQASQINSFKVMM